MAFLVHFAISIFFSWMRLCCTLICNNRLSILLHLVFVTNSNPFQFASSFIYSSWVVAPSQKSCFWHSIGFFIRFVCRCSFEYLFWVVFLVCLDNVWMLRCLGVSFGELSCPAHRPWFLGLNIFLIQPQNCWSETYLTPVSPPYRTKVSYILLSNPCKFLFVFCIEFR